MRLKTVGVVTLVLMMVLSFASLASADEATDAASTTVAPGSDSEFSVRDPGSGFTEKLLDFVLFWGYEAKELTTDGCPPVTSGGEVAPDATVPTVCLDVTGPNGQVNHGTFVSAFVHWLKSDEGKSLLKSYDGPRGQLVKQAAKSDFKGPKTELPIAETEVVQPKGWSNPHNPHS